MSERKDPYATSEQRFRKLAEATEVGIWQIAPGGETLYANPALCRILGVDRPEQLSRAEYLSFFTEDSRRRIRAQQVQRPRGVSSSYEAEVLGRDGKTRQVMICATPLFEADGELSSLIGTFIDVSELKRAEDEKGRLEAQLRQSQKMETVGQLAGGVAHDFNNLLLAILGYAELAMIGLGPEEERLDHIRQIHGAAERAGELVKKLLAFSRRQVIDPVHLDLNQTLRELMAMLRRLIPENIGIDFVPADRPELVHVDRAQFEQAIVNLCVNARDAIESAGTIRIRTSDADLDEDYCRERTAARFGRYVVVSIEDDGVGMDPEVEERIFEPFFTTKPHGLGTGLGLAMVYGIVKQHDGWIDVESCRGKGSTFRIYLPRSGVQPGRDEERAEAPVEEGTETILVVEDETIVRKLLVRILEHNGYRVLEAGDGMQALEIYRRRHGEISLLILDVVMPTLNGRAVYEAAREIDPSVPALFVSGYALEGIHSNFVLEEGFEVIAKPYRPQQLLRRVRRMLDRTEDPGGT